MPPKRGYIETPHTAPRFTWSSAARTAQRIRREATRTVGRVAGRLAARTAGIGAAFEAAAGFVEAVRPYKRTRREEVFNTMNPEYGSSGNQYTQRRSGRRYCKLGSRRAFKERKLHQDHLVYHWRLLGTNEWGSQENKIFHIRPSFGAESAFTVNVNVIGQMPMLNMVNIASFGQDSKLRQFLPVQLYSVTTTPNLTTVRNPTTGITSSAFINMTNNCVLMQEKEELPGGVLDSYGFYPLQRFGNNPGSSVFGTNLMWRGLRNDGDLENHATHDKWQYKIKNTLGITSSNVQNYCILKSVTIKLDLWGAKKAPTMWRISLVQFPERTGPEYIGSDLPPNEFAAGTGERSEYVSYFNTQSGAVAHKYLWNPRVNHPWNQDVVPSTDRIRVLKSWTYNMQPISTTESDDRPHNKLLTLHADLNRQLNFNWTSALINPVDTDIGDNSVQVVRGNDNKIEVHPNARIYVMVSCDNYKRVNPLDIPVVNGKRTVNDDFIPSYNIIIQKHLMVNR